MPATWIIERPTIPRPAPRPAERPRLELPLHQPAFERARPHQPAESEQAERGAAVIDFYI